jgi:hypothetical protein
MGVYPFMFGCAKDFPEIIDEMEKVSSDSGRHMDQVLIADQKDIKSPYDWEQYAEVHFPKAQELEAKAAAAETAGDKAQASEYYL